MAFALLSLKTFMAVESLPSYLHSDRLFGGHVRLSNLVLPRHTLGNSTLTFSRRRNQNSAITTSSSSKKDKDGKEEENDIDEEAFEALFDMLDEELKNDDSSISDGIDNDINEEELEKLQLELEEALGDDNHDDIEMFGSAGDDVETNNDAVDEEVDEEEEKPVKLKNWQLRRLAYALKTGRRKVSIKSLAGDVCLDRAIVLKLLREPPPNLVLMSAALPDKPPPTIVMPDNKAFQTFPRERTTMNAVKSKSEEKLPIHVLQQKWYAQKRLKKVQVDTLEKVYRRTKRPTNAMVSSIVQLINLPRKRVVQWFEDKRNEEGVPQRQLPYQRSVPETVSSN